MNLISYILWKLKLRRTFNLIKCMNCCNNTFCPLSKSVSCFFFWYWTVLLVSSQIYAQINLLADIKVAPNSRWQRPLDFQCLLKKVKSSQKVSFWMFYSQNSRFVYIRKNDSACWLRFLPKGSSTEFSHELTYYL